MPKCCVMGCSNRSSRDRVKFFRFPNDRRSKERSELTNARQLAWLYAINRLDLKDSSLKETAICSEHFISGRPALDKDKLNPDWVPSLKMGYETNEKDSESAKWIVKKSSSEWTQETTLQLIDLWKQHPCLYDPAHGLYGKREARNDALTKITDDIQLFMGNMTQEDIKIKINDLRLSYYKLKEQKDRRKYTADSEDGSSVYWFCKLSFLKDFLTTKQRNNFDVKYDESLENSSNILENAFLSKSETSKEAFLPGITSIKNELSQESELLTEASDPLSLTSSTMVQTSGNSTRYPDDVEAFGEHVKAEVNKVFDDELRDEAVFKINNIMYEIKAKQRILNSH